MRDDDERDFSDLRKIIHDKIREAHGQEEAIGDTLILPTKIFCNNT